MRFVEISLLYILSVILTTWGSEKGPVPCAVTNFLPIQDILFILQTPDPIGNSWEAVIVLLDSTEKVDKVNIVGFDFNLPVEVNIEINGKRTNLPYQSFNDADTRASNSFQFSGFKAHYIYENGSENLNVIKIFVEDKINNTTPELTALEFNDEGTNLCDRLKIIPWDNIDMYKIFPTRNEYGSYTLSISGENNNAAQDLSVYMKDVYSTNIKSKYNGTVQDNVLPTSCGKRLINEKKVQSYVKLVASGYRTEPGDWPWHAAIFHTSRTTPDYKCGGSLITRNVILTAAHCLYDGNRPIIPNNIIVKLGLRNKFSDPNGEKFNVQQVIIHEKYMSETTSNDIGILHLATQPVLNNYIQPVCLWRKDQVDINHSEGKSGYVIGWGLNENKEFVDQLAEGRMLVVSYGACLDELNGFYGQFLNSNTFCAGYRNGTSVCNGDSGGGMFFQDPDGTFRIRGIVSLAKAKEMENYCDRYNYVIFTNVGPYLNWIETKIYKKFG